MSRRGRRHPDQVVRVPVPPLGTTWYDRGVAYWVRRAWFAAMMLIALVTASLFAGGLISAAWQSHPAAGAAVGSVIGGTGLVSGVWLWRRSTPTAIEERARAGKVTTAPSGATGVAGGVLGVTALAGNMLAVAIVVVGSSLMLGVIVVFLLRSLGSQLPQERVERVLLNVPLRPRRLTRDRAA
jgi:hypothetical protein